MSQHFGTERLHLKYMVQWYPEVFHVLPVLPKNVLTKILLNRSSIVTVPLQHWEVTYKVYGAVIPGGVPCIKTHLEVVPALPKNVHHPISYQSLVLPCCRCKSDINSFRILLGAKVISTLSGSLQVQRWHKLFLDPNRCKSDINLSGSL